MKNRNRRTELLRRLKVDLDALAAQPQITPTLKLCGVLPERLMEVLRVDLDPASQAAVRVWDARTPAERRLLGLEAIALLADLTPRRLWELYSGATMMQSRDVLGVMLAESLPAVMRVTIKEAKKPKGLASREHILKAARVLPTPKGSTTNINVGASQQVGDGDQAGELTDGRGELEQADAFYMRASRAMQPRGLPAPPAEIVDADVEEEDEEE